MLEYPPRRFASIMPMLKIVSSLFRRFCYLLTFSLENRGVSVFEDYSFFIQYSAKTCWVKRNLWNSFIFRRKKTIYLCEKLSESLSDTVCLRLQKNWLVDWLSTKITLRSTLYSLHYECVTVYALRCRCVKCLVRIDAKSQRCWPTGHWLLLLMSWIHGNVLLTPSQYRDI